MESILYHSPLFFSLSPRSGKGEGGNLARWRRNMKKGKKDIKKDIILCFFSQKRRANTHIKALRKEYNMICRVGAYRVFCQKPLKAGYPIIFEKEG